MSAKNRSQSMAQQRKERDRGKNVEDKTGFGSKKLEGPNRPSTN